MEQGCRGFVEPRWYGIHDLMVRLLGRCTCESESRVVQLYTVEGCEEQRVSA